MKDSILLVSGVLLRAASAGAILWNSTKVNKHGRFYSGAITFVLGGALAFTYLEPLFHSVGMPLATVALFILSIISASVGMCLGVLLPLLLPGACFGCLLVLLISIFLPPLDSIDLAIPYSTMAVICGFMSIRNQSIMLRLASLLEVGGLAGSILVPNLFICIKAVLRGESFRSEGSNLYLWQIESQHLLGLIWIFSTICSAIICIYREGSLYWQTPTPYSSGNVQNSSSNQRIKKSGDPPLNHQPPPSSPDAYNMFDPADLPPRLAEYANMVYSACEDLGNFFGFQDASVRNQAEHLLILLSNNRRYMSSDILPPSMQPPSPIHALHAKVFSNYMKWCRAMRVPPNFSKMNASMSAPPAVTSRVVDLVLFFCVWGEGCNVRHMPECMWFLYHKMMEEYTLSEGYTQTRSLYAGYFVQNVITPIYDIVAQSMKSTKDHLDRRNYDDFNEFFWSRNCLNYQYSADIGRNLSADLENSPRSNGLLTNETLPFITEGLTSAPKTFLEKRSWLRGIISLYRILEWHLITFYLLAVVAFSRHLVWDWVYTLQVASGVFWIFNCLSIMLGILEVWAVFPGIQLTEPSICGFVFSLCARFLILIYQTLYLMWTFGPSTGSSRIYLGIEADANFWWWQYVWLSLLCMIPWFIAALTQFYPAITTRLYTSQNDYVQSFLYILFPLSRLYVGKEVHESFEHTIIYIFYWGTLMAWKLFFSYTFEVDSMVLPTLELTDDYMNFPDQSFAKMSLLLTMRWLPQFLVYLIDMSIWYSVWQAFAGTTVGFSEHLGDVKSVSDIRANFGRAPEHFCRKMLSHDAGSRRGSSASFLASSSNSLGEEGKSLLGTDPHKLQSYMNRLLDVRIQKWVMFSTAWNEIIDCFRQEDIISNRERDNLKFSRFEGFSQAVYLPVFQTAGVFEDVLTVLETPRDENLEKPSEKELFQPILDHITMCTAVSELWELGSFLMLRLLGSVHNDDVVAITSLFLKWSENGTLSQNLKIEKMRNVIKEFIQLVKILEKGVGRRKPFATPRLSSSKAKLGQLDNVNKISRKPIRRAVSAASLTNFATNNNDVSNWTMQKAKKATISEKEIMIDALRDQTRDKLRAMMYALKHLLNSTDFDLESKDVLDRLTFLLSMEKGFMWDDAYASDQLDMISKNVTFTGVLTKVHGLVACHPDDVMPKSKEARRRLNFFVNSLFMDMPDAPSIHDMFSWNVMTPYYSEDVTYTKADLEQRTDALGVSTLLYLQTLFRTDWNNFLERLSIHDEEKIWSKKYIEEARIWASNRAQTLSRTVSGMMYYEKALRLLANLERVNEDTTDDLLGEKFGYIVSCQVYGNMKKNQDSKADDIDQLMHRYPHLRVAYIDNIRLNRAGASAFYSVLVKSDGCGGIQEIYRVRLPGNPVLGEGKPENQNHAMIFTRAEFLQTIDMNQEGYFEEALKMRNALQEFAKREGPLPTTILGLREHIFTGSVSSLANYMALQETSFVTLGQRVLTKPLRIRLHYGHPDVFDKLFFITRGGISKSSKGINLSEDIFAGYNNAIRGGQVSFKEYLQVGKGRDVGMSQIYKFEAKLSQGAGEQSLSRDIYRLCHRLDFCRLLSFYFGGIGHYFSNVLTVFTIYCVVYLMVVLAIYDLEKIGDRVITPMGTIQMLLGGLGLLQTIPLFATLGVERGWWNSLKEIASVFITGGPLHFMFHIQTKAYYMTQTILVGGAKYRATGRGFVTQHTPMDEQFRFFASSHLYLGVELASSLILMGIFTNAGQYIGRTWSLWLASTSFLSSPFWFNPLSFEWSVVVSDYSKYLDWMQGSSGGALKSWSMWWTEENSHYKKMKIPSKVLFLAKSVLYILVAEGIRTSDLLKSDVQLHKPLVTIGRLVTLIICFVASSYIFTANEHALPYPIRRTIGIIITICLSASVVLIYTEDSNFVRYSLAAYYGIGAFCQVGLLIGIPFVKHFYFVHDFVCGHIIFIPLFILAALQLPHHIQTWLLYHSALSSDVVVNDILRYARKSQEAGGVMDQNEDLVEQVTELRKQMQKQEMVLQNAGLSKTSLFTDRENEKKNVIEPSYSREEDIVQVQVNRPQPVGLDGAVRRHTVSMTGLDVYGAMAMGGADIQEQGGIISNDPTASDISNYSTTSGVNTLDFSQPDTMPPRC